MDFHSPGWLKRYITFRLKNPFEFWDSVDELRENYEKSFFSDDFSVLDDIFYKTLRQNGVLFGCCVLDKKQVEKYPGLRFLSLQDEATFVNTETLFTALMHELVVLVPNFESYGQYLARVLIRTIQFYLGCEVDTPYFGMKTEELLLDREFSKLIRKFEKKFLNRVKIEKKLSLTNSLQNNFSFLDIYSLISWNRLFHQQSSTPIYFLQEIEKNHIVLQKQLVLIFAGLVWQSQENDSLSHHSNKNNPGKEESDKQLLQQQKMKMLKRYIKTARLPSQEKKELYEIIKNPVDIHKIEYEVSDAVINKYMLEQTILLSLIDEELDPSHVSFVFELGKNLGMDWDNLEASISSVAEFFHQNEDRFDFIRGNRNFHHLKMRINSQITLVIRKNLDRIMQEIKRTGTLYSLLVKSGTEELNEEEKKFVRDQLLSIAKTIPALAIFCLPAGGMVLAVFIKVLPFNILPNSFVE